MYTGGTNDLNTRHNEAMVFINLMKLHQDRFQSIQDLQDQYLALIMVCDVLELCFGRCKGDARAILKKKNVTGPTNVQLKKALDKIEEELNAIVFMYKADRQKYSKPIEQMQHGILQKRPFSKNCE